MYENGTLEITTVGLKGCDLSCKYCPQSLLRKKMTEFNADRYLSFKNFKICVDKCPANKVIDFSGLVEPFLSPYCSTMMLYVHDTGRRIRLFTTGTGMSKTDVDMICSIPFLGVSLHLPDNLGVMAGAKVDDEYIDTLQYFIKKINCDGHSFGPLHEKLNFVKNRIPFKEKQLNNSDLITRGGNLDVDTKLVQLRPVQTKLTPGVCRPIADLNKTRLDHNVLVPINDTTVSVQICCCSYGLDYDLGNLLECSYEDLFKSPNYYRIQRILNGEEEGMCTHCEMKMPIGYKYGD